MQKEKLIEDVDKKLQFTLVLALFFPVLLEALFDLSGANHTEASNIILKWSLVIFLLILNYLIFESKKAELSIKSLKYLGWVFVSNTLCYALVILSFGISTTYVAQTDNQILVFMYSFALYGIMTSPVIALFIMLLDLVHTEFTGFWKELKKRNK